MRKIRYAVILAALAMAGCHHPEVIIEDFETFHVTSVKTADFFLSSGNMSPNVSTMGETELDDSETKVASTAGASIVRDILGVINSNSLIHIAGTYTGRGVDGKPITLSGKVIVPASGKVKNMILVSHYTIGANFECPSETFPMEGVFATKGYAVVIADYIGFGVTSDLVHPYLHAESTAESVVDMALAVKPYLEHIGRAPESNEVILAGYSQGGATTMAVMDYIQDNYWDKLPVKKVYAGGGPYDLAATFDLSMAEDKTGIPCAIPMIVQGINNGERLGLDMKDFFQPKLLANYNEWINSKKYTVGQINRLMGVKALSELMTDEGRNKESTRTALLYKALMRNSVLNFAPRAPIFMFHSRTDGTVPFINAQRAEEHFKGYDIQYDFGDYGPHAMACVRFIIKVTQDL